MLDAGKSEVLKALQRKPRSRIPVWFMRQAGRFLPEYCEIRKKHSMLDVIRTPELAAEVTLQPLDRFELDAGIIFADILNPLMGMGIELDFVAGEGPKIFNPIREAADVKRLVVPSVEENVGYTLEAIRRVTAKIHPRGIPLLGFSGAPFTLSSYMIEGTSGAHLQAARHFMLSEPEAWAELQEKLSEMITAYLVAQVEAGVSAVQIFDSWAGYLGPSEYRKFVAPYLRKIISDVRRQANAPVVYFSTGTAGLLHEIAELGADAIGLDWRSSISRSLEILGRETPVQGNLDPCVLAGPLPYLEEQVRSLLDEAREVPHYIFNLGHGILPHTPIDNVRRVIELVRGAA